MELKEKISLPFSHPRTLFASKEYGIFVFDMLQSMSANSCGRRFHPNSQLKRSFEEERRFR